MDAIGRVADRAETGIQPSEVILVRNQVSGKAIDVGAGKLIQDRARQKLVGARSGITHARDQLARQLMLDAAYEGDGSRRDQVGIQSSDRKLRPGKTAMAVERSWRKARIRKSKRIFITGAERKNRRIRCSREEGWQNESGRIGFQAVLVNPQRRPIAINSDAPANNPFSFVRWIPRYAQARAESGERMVEDVSYLDR